MTVNLLINSLRGNRMSWQSVHQNCLTHPGVAVIREHNERGDRWLTVEQADPQIEVDGDLLRRFASGQSTWLGIKNGIRLVGIPDDAAECYPHPGSIYFDFTGCLLHLDGRNQHVVYRIGDYVAERDAWAARWPD